MDDIRLSVIVDFASGASTGAAKTGPGTAAPVEVRFDVGDFVVSELSFSVVIPLNVSSVNAEVVSVKRVEWKTLGWYTSRKDEDSSTIKLEVITASALPVISSFTIVFKMSLLTAWCNASRGP